MKEKIVFVMKYQRLYYKSILYRKFGNNKKELIYNLGHIELSSCVKIIVCTSETIKIFSSSNIVLYTNGPNTEMSLSLKLSYLV